MSAALVVVVAVVVVIALLAVALRALFRVPAADQALIITGGGTKGRIAGAEGRTYKIVTGGGALVVPVVQKAQYLSMASVPCRQARTCEPFGPCSVVSAECT